MKLHSQLISGAEGAIKEDTPYAALSAFYSAFNGRDSQLMRNNWLQTEEASMSNPLGGIKRGWHEINQVYDRIFHGPAQVYVEFYNYSIQQTSSMFCAVGSERGELHMHGEILQLAIRTSRIYCRQNGRWQQLHHHGSMDNPQLLLKYQTILLEK